MKFKKGNFSQRQKLRKENQQTQATKALNKGCASFVVIHIVITIVIALLGAAYYFYSTR